MSRGVDHRCSLDPALLWYRPAAISLIQSLDWELPYVEGVGLKKKKKDKLMNKKMKINSQYNKN